ncbi:Probable caffeoyl-CoA O-methyltransferase At4g26220 [Linum perenne]
MEGESSSERRPLPSKGLLRTEALYQYVLETSVFPREPQPLKELRNLTATHPRSLMATAPDAAQLLSLLLKLINAKKTIEVGVFTGYSLLLTALSIPHDGKITAIDMSRESYEIGLPIIRKAGVEHKIDFVESEAAPFLDKLLLDDVNEGSYDFAYVDADKNNYWNYHNKLMKLVRVGGVIAYDNTLWGGTVAMSPPPETNRTADVREFTIQYPRVDISHTPLGDGLTICRRIY